MTTSSIEETYIAGRSAAEFVAAEVRPGAIVGLGTGRAATAFVEALARRAAAGLQVRCVPTSMATAELARRLGLELVDLQQVERLDLAVDGADEVSPTLDLLKGFGGALVREKIVAEAAEEFVVLITPEKRQVHLGARGRLPVELAMFALEPCRRRLSAQGLPSEVRTVDGRPVISDNGNPLLDVLVSHIDDPAACDRALCQWPGVLGTGLFAGVARRVVCDEPHGVLVHTRLEPCEPFHPGGLACHGRE